MCGFCNVWARACVGFMVCGCFEYRVDVLVISVFVFIVFFYCFGYVYLLLFVASVRTTATE